MKSDFMTTIGEVAEVFDGPHATPTKVENGPYFLSISSLENGSLDLSKSAHLSNEDFEKWTRRVTPQAGDVLFSYETRLGDAALMPPNVTACLGRRMGLLRPIRNKVIPEYLLYAYLSPAFQEIIRSKTIHGATVDRIALKELPDFPIRIPPIDEQLKAVSVLNSINSRLELNRQTNQTLEQIAQAIFKSWFVDFDPVRAKIAAREAFIQQHPEVTEEAIRAAAGTEGDTLAHAGAKACELAAICAISGKTEEQLAELDDAQGSANVAGGRKPGATAETLQQLKATAALFPDALVDSELVEVPEGWKVSEIGNEVVVVGGGTPSTKNPDFWEGGEIHWTTPKDMSNLTDKILLDTERKITEKGLAKISSELLPEGTVLMSSRAPVGYLAISKIRVAINQGYIAMKCEGSLSPEYVIQWAESVMDDIKQRASGTTFAEISKKNFRVIPVVVPTNDVIDVYTKHVSMMYSKITESLVETKHLIDTRDTLLPKLLSGEFDMAS